MKKISEQKTERSEATTDQTFSPKKRKKKEKNERDKKGRYWGIILLLLTVLLSIAVKFLQT